MGFNRVAIAAVAAFLLECEASKYHKKRENSSTALLAPWGYTSSCVDNDAGVKDATGDPSLSCAAAKDWCENDQHAATMKTLCPGTCGLCMKTVGTNTWNNAVQSINLASAPRPKFWNVIPGSPSAALPPVYGNDLTDPNAVHGAALPNGGGVVHAGIGASGGTNGPRDAFAAKFSASGDFVWGWKSNRAGIDLANAVCVLPSGEIIIAGVAQGTSDATLHRALWKLSSSGALVWTATFDDTLTSNGGFEMCEVGQDSLILSGFRGKRDGTVESYLFKSYGNVDCFLSEGCKGNVVKIPFTALAGTAAPTVKTPGYLSRDFPGMATSKAARELPTSKDIAVVFYKSGSGFNLAMVNATLGDKWVWSSPSDTGHEASDLAVSADQQQILVSGHGKGTPENRPNAAQLDGTYQGFLSSYSVADGSKVWTKSYGAGGNPLLIFNECWGVSTVAGGYILTCGTGIECDPGTCCATDTIKQHNLEDKCKRGIGDDSAGAVARAPGKWNSMVIKTDTQGNLLWQRVDGTLAADGTNPSPQSSAAEFSVSTSNGIYVQTDINIGFGVLYLEF